MSEIELKLNQAISAYLRTAAATAEGITAPTEHLFGTGAVAELEKKIARHYRKKHALCLSNATTALFALGLAMDLKDSAFLTTPYTYGGSLASWLLLGGKAVFADIDRLTLTLDPQRVKKLMTKQVKAILAVDIFGNPADMFALRKIADEFGLPLITDAAQSLGATRQGFPAGYAADAVVLSFTSGKTLFAGEGGAIVTDNSNLYEKLLFYSQHPFRQKRELGLFVSNEFGFNGRIHPLAAVWANTQFETALCLLKARQTECFRIIEFLNESSLTELITFAEQGIIPSFFRFTAELKRAGTQAGLASYLAGRSVRATTAPVPVSLIYRQPAFLAQYKNQFSLPAPCRVAERQGKKRIVINLFRKNESNQKRGHKNF